MNSPPLAIAACLVGDCGGDAKEALRRYEARRRPRVTHPQEMSRANKTRFHLPDGPAQRTRDAEWAKSGDRSPDALRWPYDFDAGIFPATVPTLREIGSDRLGA